jgi:hypothetical protein
MAQKILPMLVSMRDMGSKMAPMTVKSVIVKELGLSYLVSGYRAAGKAFGKVLLKIGRIAG